MNEHRDIVIAGGGMVGVSLALALGAVLPPSVQITLVERFAFPQAAPGSAPDYHPSFDARVTALSYSSRLIYQQMGVWEALSQWLCPIDQIHVSNRGHFGSTVMHAGDYDWPALGYVVENAWLGNSLAQALHAQGRVELRAPAKVEAVRVGATGVTLQLEGEGGGELEAALLLVADGADSSLREQLGVAIEDKAYQQHALVANVAFAQGHSQCAFERFTRDGPVALLPLLPAPGGEHRAGLVWTVPPDQAKHLLQADDTEFLAALQECFGYRLGRFTQVGERQGYPLRLVQAAEQVRQSVAVVGNAAHALHPVAGQGFNLALRDVAVLAEVLTEAALASRGFGDLPVLLEYQRRARVDQLRTVNFSDKLPALFMQSDPVLGLARDIGLAGLDMVPAAKRAFVRYAAGVAGTGR